MTHLPSVLWAVIVLILVQIGLSIWWRGVEQKNFEDMVVVQRVCAARLDGILKRNAIADAKQDEIARLLQKHDAAGR